MRKYVLLVFAIILSCVNVLLAQTIWENSECLYQSNNTKILLRESISTGIIIFYTVNDTLYLNTFDDIGDPTIEEALNLGLNNDEQTIFNITSSSDDKFIIAWRELDNLKVQKYAVTGSPEWNSAISIPLNNYLNYTVRESVIIEESDIINLVVSYRDNNSTDCIANYQIDISSNIPQIADPEIIYSGDDLYSLNGISTAEGITLLWSNDVEEIVQIYKNGVIYESPAPSLSYGRLNDTNETGKIIELDENRTVYSLTCWDYLGFDNVNSALYIFNEIDSTFTNIPHDFVLLDIQKISENEFMSVTMSNSEVIFTKYDQAGEIISTHGIAHPFELIFVEGDFLFDEISSVDSRVDGSEYKLALATMNVSAIYGYNPDLIVFNFDLNTEEASVIDKDLPSLQYTFNSSMFVNLGDSNVSVLDNLSEDNYRVYKQLYSPYQENAEVNVSPYEICKTYPNKYTKLQSFIWQDSNQVLLGNDYQEESKLHQISNNSFLLFYEHHGFFYFQSNYRIKLYKEDGTTEVQNLQSFYDYYIFSSFIDVNDGNGWFVYKSNEYNFHRIENSIFQSEYSQPISDLTLIAMKDNYLIMEIDNQFKLTKIDDEGNIASGWDSQGEAFTIDYDSEITNAQLYSYQNKLIFCYHANESYKSYLIDPQNLDDTIVHSQASWEIPTTYISESTNEFIIANNLYFIQSYNGNLTMYCYDLENNFAQVWQREIASNVGDNFSIKELDNRFVVAYSQGNSGSERVYLHTVGFNGSLDQYAQGYAIPLNLERKYSPAISVVDNNTIYVNRIENSSLNLPGVYCDLIDLSYFVPNSSEDVAPLTLKATNYPNPFNPETTISYNLPKAGVTKVEVFNLKGQLVKTLVNEVQAEGNQKVIWKGNNNQDKQVSSGIYLYKIKTTGDVISGKMVLMK